MKTAFYTIADLGDYSNLKSPESLGIINALDNPIVYCRSYKGKNPNYKPLFSKKIHPMLYSFLGKRDKANKIMDKKAKLENVDTAIFMSGNFEETVNEYKDNRIKTIMIGTSGCGPAYDIFAEEEHQLFNLPYRNSLEQARLLNKADYIITYSNWFKELYIKNGFPEENIFLCPLGVDIEKFKPGKKEDKVFRVVCVADFQLMKGLQYLLSAWDSLDLWNAELVLVGNKPDYMKKIIGEREDIKLVKHTSPLPYYQNASLFVLPSLSEGSSRVMYEAMACGIPVLVTDNCGPIIIDRDKTFGIVNKDNGKIVPIKDSYALADAIRWFYDNKLRAQQLGRNAREHIKKFTWENYTNRIKEILKIIK